ncbi:hypothetical protein LXL04_003015 [Taraxacum kok-saghyz]
MQSDASYHSDAQPEQQTPPRQTEVGTSKTPPEQPKKDTNFDNLENITKLTQTPPVPPHETEKPEQTNKPSLHQSDSEHADDEIILEGPDDDLFNPNKATSSSYVPPADRFTFFPVTFEEEPLTSEQEDLFATKKDISSLRTVLNTILVGMDPSKRIQQEEQAKKYSEEVKEIRKEILTSIDTLQADFTSKVSDVEKNIEGIAQTATSDSELKAQLHAQEIKLKELATQLESKTHEAEHRLRVIDMYKVQNQDMNLKLVKLIEDKDAQVLKLSDKVDEKFEQMIKAISEISVPKVVEKIVERKSPPKQSKQQPQQKQTSKPKRPIIKGVIINPPEGSSSKKTKPSEPEPEGRGKAIVTTEPNPKEIPDTSKDEELARKLAEDEEAGINANAEKENLQIKASEVRIWPVWTRAKIMKVALPEADPYWLHPIASQRVNFDANYQLDMPLCPRAFIFKYMEPLAFFNGDDEMMNKILIDFYSKKSKPQQEFEITIGTEKTKSTISFAEIPLLNPSDWITIHQILVLRCEDYLKPHIKVFKLLMQNYMFEMGKFDIVAAEIMKTVPKTVVPVYCDYEINSDGLITKDPWGIVVKITENDVFKFGHLMMTDLYTLALNHLRMLKQKIFLQSRNSLEARKEVFDRIVWHEAVRSKIITFYNFMLEHEEK